MAVTYRLCKQAVPYKTRLTGWLISYREAEFRSASRKAHLAKNEGFGANTPDLSPILLSNQ
jgi:hypothetical protein